MNKGRARRVVTVTTFAFALAACSEPVEPSGAAAPGPVSSESTTEDPVPTSVGSRADSIAPSSTTTQPAGVETLPPAPTVPRIPNEGSAEVLRLRWRYWETFDPGPLVVANGPPPALLEPGTHRTDVLGIETTLVLDDWWRLEAENPGSFWLGRPDSPLEALSPLVFFTRPAGLVEPANVADHNLLAGDGVEPAGDLGAWLARVPQIEVAASGPAVADDRTGTWYDVAVDPDAGPTLGPCPAGPDCVYTWWPGTGVQFVASDSGPTRYYDFPDEAGPIYLIVAAEADEWDSWLDRVDALIRSTTFGPSAPHPVPADEIVGGQRGHASGVPMRLSSFPGLVLTPGRHSLVVQRGTGYLRVDPWGPSAGRVLSVIVRPVTTAAGVPLRSADDVVDGFVAAGLTRGEDESVAGVTASVVSGEITEPLIRYAEVAAGDASIVDWPEQSGFVHAWVFDSPIGPLVLAAEAETESKLGAAVVQARQLGAEIAFDCRVDECDTAGD